MAKFNIKTVKPKFIVATVPDTKIDVSINRPIITAKNQKAYFKLKNTGGPKGEKGDPGTAATITVGSTSTGAPGTNASVTNSGTSSAAVLDFTIPRGDKGDTGATGSPGAAATVSVGATTTGQPGTNASVTNSGTQSAAVLNFTIPKGDKGDNGNPGSAATIAVGTVTTLQPNQSAYVTNVGTSSAAIFDIGIPKGEQGQAGSGSGDMLASDYDPNNAVKTAGGIPDYVAAHEPTKTSDLQNDGADGTSTYVEADELATVATTGAYSDLSGTPSLATVATSGSYTDLTDTPTIPTVNNATLTIQKNSTDVATFTANASSNVTADISVPTKTSDLTNDSGFLTASETITASGSDITVALNKDASIADYKLNGNATQTGTPTPSSPVAVQTVSGTQTVSITGKNLLDNSNPSVVNTGITWTPTATGGTFTRPSGTWGDGVQWRPILEAGQTYAVQMVIPDSGPVYLNIRTYTDSTYSTVKTNYYADKRGSFSGTFTPDTNYVQIRLANNGAASNVAITDIMLEKSPTVTTFEPYVAPQSYNIDLTSKNLFDISTLAKGSVTVSSGVATGTASNFNSSFGANTTGIDLSGYTSGAAVLSATARTNGTASNNGLLIRVIYTDSTQSEIVWPNNTSTATRKTLTIDGSKTVSKIIISFANTGTNTWYLSDIQLEYGATTTDFTPYYNYELCKINTYQDYIYNDGGTWKIHKEISKAVINGTENNWGYNSTNKVFWANCFNVLPDIPSGTNGYFAKLCDHFEYHASSGNNASLADGLYENNATTNLAQVLFHYSAVTTLADWKTWLGNNPITIYYQKPTATDTAITDSTLIAQLNAILTNSELVAGTDYIKLTPTSGAQGTLDVTLLTSGLPVATTSTPGVVSIGTGLTITPGGKLSVDVAAIAAAINS